MLTFSFTGADGTVLVPETLTTGMVGRQAAFRFSEDWDGLRKNAVFRAGKVKRVCLDVGERCAIPWEVLEKPLERLEVGLWGVSADGKTVIPTIRVMGPEIQPGVEPEGDPGVDATLPVWGQLQALIGDPTRLDTEDYSSLVGAVNEVHRLAEEAAKKGNYYLPTVTQTGEQTICFDFSPSDAGMPALEPVELTLPQGPKGEKGDMGEAPVRGRDYWTAADVAEIQSYVDNAILGGSW